MRDAGTSAHDLDALRNQAVAAWIKTYPVDDRLSAFLERVPDVWQDDISRSARAIVRAALASLEEAGSTGPVDITDFHGALEQQLRRSFPWVEEPALRALRSYTGWYAWHEGY